MPRSVAPAHVSDKPCAPAVTPGSPDGSGGVAPRTRRAWGLGQEAPPPLGKRARELFCREAVNDLCLRETITEPLPLRVLRDRQAFETHRNEVGTRQEKEQIPPQRGHGARGPAALEMDDDNPEQELADAAADERVTHQHVDSS